MKPLKRKILYAEDHEDMRDLVVLVLAKANYDVVTAPSIADALTRAKAEVFDLFMLDARLADGSGVELCKRIREFDCSTPILFYSAWAFEEDMQEAFKSGAQKYW